MRAAPDGGRFDLPGAKGNHGLLIDPRDRLAFIACEGNDKLLVFDLCARRVVHSFDIGSAPDVLAFDSVQDTLYVVGEAGIGSMFSVRGSKVTKIGEGSPRAECTCRRCRPGHPPVVLSTDGCWRPAGAACDGTQTWDSVMASPDGA